MRLIDADAALKVYETAYAAESGCGIGTKNGGFYVCDPYDDCAKCILENAPTVDAVPVVRCKDCRFYTEVGMCEVHPYDDRFNVSYYCADGMRKDGKEEEDGEN